MRCRTGSHRRPLRRCRSAMEFGPWRCDVRGGRARRRSSNMRCRVRRHGRSLRRLRWMKGRCGGTRHRRRRCRTRHRRRCCWMRRRSRPPGQPWRTASSMLLGERTHACSKHGNTNQKRCTMNTARKHDHELPVGSGRPPKSTRGRKKSFARLRSPAPAVMRRRGTERSATVPAAGRSDANCRLHGTNRNALDPRRRHDKSRVSVASIRSSAQST